MVEEITTYKRDEIDKKLGTEQSLSLLQTIMADDIQVSLLKLNQTMEKLSEHSELTEFDGEVDSLTLAATEEEKFASILELPPRVPWISATFLNSGPNTAYIKINYNANWVPVFKKIPLQMDFAGSKDKKRIQIIRYKCNAGETATITVVGKY